MFEIQGKYTTARIYADVVEESAMSQIYAVCNSPAFENSKIVIQPDVHAGAGCVIGFTAIMKDKITPNLLGVDISCGMLTVELGNINVDYSILDDYIKKYIPHGFGINSKMDADVPPVLVQRVGDVCDRLSLDADYMLKSIGSLGSGNHFCEVNVGSDGRKYLVIHSGSRNFGKRICDYYQDIAIKHCDGKGVERALSYLEGADKDAYLHDMRVASQFAMISREIMADRILQSLGTEIGEVASFETVHNYYDTATNIVRKGAIAAYSGQKVLIPMNMRDGSILAVGKGNAEANYSAPHGAGRLMSRGNAKRTFSMAEFIKEMGGVYSTSVREDTLDESPMAYKKMEDIIGAIGDMVDIVDVLKPLYNFKS